MPIIQMHILEGRPDALKQKLIAEVTDAVSRTLGTPPDAIRVLLYEIPKTHWAVGGKSMAEREQTEGAGELLFTGQVRGTGLASVDMERAVSVDDPGPDM